MTIEAPAIIIFRFGTIVTNSDPTVSAALRSEPSMTCAYTLSVVSTFACPINCCFGRLLRHHAGAPNLARSALLALNAAAPSSSDSATAIGPASRIASTVTLRDTPASSSPAPTDIAIEMRRCGIRENAPAITPTSSPTEDTAPNARAAQTS